MDFSRLSEYEKVHIYTDSVVPIIDQEALFSDGTEEYRVPQEPEKNEIVKLRLRTGKENVEHAYLIIDDEPLLMKKRYSDEYFDYYEAEHQLYDTRVEYYFAIMAGEVVCYYNARGVAEEKDESSNFFIYPGFKTPDWAKGAVFYQIFVDRFYNGDPSNDVEDREYQYIGEPVSKVKDWEKYPAQMGVREFYGGDLQGVLDKLDYIQNLGVEVLYLNPIFVSPSNHKYDIQDYDYVDPHYGKIVKDEGKCLDENAKDNKGASRYICRVTHKENLEASNEFFAEFVEEVHRRGMKIILDGVFNHCGSFNKWLDREQIYEFQEGYEKGAFVDEASPYKNYFHFSKEEWPENSNYDGWWGHDTLPKLNFEESKELFEDILRIGKKWVSEPYNVDGWRLDVAADLGHSREYNHYFWKKFRETVKKANPNAIILAEHYGDAESWLRGDEWDTIMNYDAFMEPITWFLTGLEKHSDEYNGELIGNADCFFEGMAYHMSRFNSQSLEVAMNELSNHDHSRFLTRTSGKVGRVNTKGPEAANEGIKIEIMRQAVVMQMTWPGAPTIYYGDEAGVCGWTDPDNRRTFPWGKENKELQELHKKLIAIHNSYLSLKRGSIIFLHGEREVISYGRTYKGEKFLVAVNRSEQEKQVSIPIWRTGFTDHETMVSLIATNAAGYKENAVIHHSKGGTLNLTLEPLSSVIMKNISF
ncbi:MAG: glycoside hydrolase family 13 protein [Acetivibrio sp.]